MAGGCRYSWPSASMGHRSAASSRRRSSARTPDTCPRRPRFPRRRQNTRRPGPLHGEGELRGSSGEGPLRFRFPLVQDTTHEGSRQNRLLTESCESRDPASACPRGPRPAPKRVLASYPRKTPLCLTFFRPSSSTRKPVACPSPAPCSGTQIHAPRPHTDTGVDTVSARCSCFRRHLLPELPFWVESGE